MCKQELEYDSTSAPHRSDPPQLRLGAQWLNCSKGEFQKEQLDKQLKHFISTNKTEGLGSRCCQPESELLLHISLDRECCGLGKRDMRDRIDTNHES